MKVILFGATGMVGQGVLFECLDAPDVTEVLLIGRSSAKVSNPKVSEVLLPDLEDYSSLAGKLGGYDACFFCLGISSAGMSEADYTKITYGYTLAAARALVQANPKMTFTYVSGEGTDSTEKGGSMWARVKGKTENDLLALGFARAVMFRPAFIQPLRGITSRTTSYRVMYALMSPFTPLIKALIPGKSTTTEKLGRAMLQVARSGAPKPILHSTEINALAEARAA
jgi:uncharacterized protein YbjT (DUF2867 family)